jgi:hypothetical protein
MRPAWRDVNNKAGKCEGERLTQAGRVIGLDAALALDPIEHGLPRGLVVADGDGSVRACNERKTGFKEIAGFLITHDVEVCGARAMKKDGLIDLRRMNTKNRHTHTDLDQQRPFNGRILRPHDECK